MSKKEEEIVKPEDYVTGAAEKMTTFLFDNIIQTIWVVIAMVWLGSAIWTSISDVFSGNLEHKVLSYTFIAGIVIAGYLQISKMVIERKMEPKTEKKKGCGKCGNKKTV
jgi:hypothetical protein